MKKTICILLTFIIMISVQAQKDEPKIVPPPDSVAFVSAVDLNAFLVWLPENITVSEYNKLKPENVISLFYRWAVAEWNKKKKK